MVSEFLLPGGEFPVIKQSGLALVESLLGLALLCHVTHILLGVLILFDPYGVVLMGGMVATNS